MENHINIKDQAIINASGLLSANIQFLDGFLLEKGHDTSPMSFTDMIEAVQGARGAATGRANETPLGVIAGPGVDIDPIIEMIESSPGYGKVNQGVYIVTQEAREGVVSVEMMLAFLMDKMLNHDPNKVGEGFWDKLPPITPAECSKVFEALQRTVGIIASQA